MWGLGWEWVLELLLVLGRVLLGELFQLLSLNCQLLKCTLSLDLRSLVSLFVGFLVLMLELAGSK